MLPKILIVDDCITVRQLKEWVEDLPEVNGMGDDTEVWIETGWCKSSPCRELCPLNARDVGTDEESCDLTISPGAPQKKPEHAVQSLIMERKAMSESKDELQFAGMEPLAEIADRMKGQDNRATAHPIFAVQQRRRIFGIDTSYVEEDGGVLWLYDGDHCADTIEELEEFFRERDLGEIHGINSQLLTEVGYTDIWEFVQPFFSCKEAERYIEENAHNLKNPRVFVYSAYRNREWQAVRDVLTEMGGKQDE